MGTVWLARDELLGREVAIKQVLQTGSTPEEIDQQRQRALREGRIAARLSHPHAISVYDVALEDGQPWLVMEYLPSRSLAEVLTQDGVLPVNTVAQVGAQVADALSATHAAGIVHRDVKPANILIGEGGRVEGLVKITDFGISHASGDVTLTQTGQITGTPAYLAPEVAQGREMTAASDVFSLGATLYTCLEGHPPFGTEDNALAMLHRVAGGQIRPPMSAGALAEPLLHMLAADPADRPTTVEVRDQLAALAAGRDGDATTVLLARTDLRTGPAGPQRTATFPAVEAATTPPAAPARVETDAVPADRRGRRALWLAAVLTALLLAGLIVFWTGALDDDSTGPTAGTPTTSTAEPATEPSAEPTTEPSTAPSTEPNAPAAEPPEATDEAPADDTDAERGEVRAKDVSRFLKDYHQQVLADPRTAYDTLTGPTLRANVGYETYAGFWGRFSKVKIKDIRAEDGSTTATATIEYTENGETFTEAHQFTLVVGADGQLLLDVDAQTG